MTLARAIKSMPATDTSGRWEAWLLSSDRQLAAELLPLLAREAPGMQVVQFEERVALESRLAGSGALPRLCFLDVSGKFKENLDLLPRLTEPPFRIASVALLGQSGHETALRCLRMGACGCLASPLDSEQLVPVLLRVGYLDSAAEGAAHQKVICVMPARGSSGATMLAANLACQAGRAGFRRVLLADMDALAGTLGFVLKLKSNYSFADALSHAAELDADLWRGLVTPYRGLDVLLSPENPMECELDPVGVVSLLAYARRTYDLILLDTGGPFSPLGLELAKLANELLLVTTSEVGVVHGATRALAYLCSNGVEKAKVKVVLSRWRRDVGFDRDEIESSLGLEVCHCLPSDPQAANDALLEGRPVAPGSPYGKSLAELASRLFEHNSVSEKPAYFKGLRSLFSLGA